MTTTQNYFRIKHGLEIASLDVFQTVDNTGPSIRPNLNLDFAGSKKLDPRITFSRASTAFYYDSDNLSKAEENLLTYSEQFNTSAGWTPSAASIVANATTAPDGTTTADKINEDSSASTYHYVGQTIAKMSTALPYTFSIYAKAAERSYIHITIYDNVSVYNRFTFNLNNGTIGNATATGGGGFSSLTTFITPVDNGWYRIGASFTSSTGTQLACHIHMTSSDSTAMYTGTAGYGVYVWGAQLEQRSFLTAYTPTTTQPVTNYVPTLLSAAANIPRFDHDPITRESKGLLVEESRTNLLTYSQNITTPMWGFYSPMYLLAANSRTAPDGTQSAHVMSTTNAGSFYKDSTVSGTGTYTVSIYVHTSSTCTSANLSLFFTGAVTQNVGITFNSATGAYISSGASNGATLVGYSITSVGNGWNRITVSGTGSNGSNTVGRFQLYSNITSQNTIVVWGPQLEAGAFATSYIPTLTTFFNRPSIATYKGSNGLVQISPINTARYETNVVGTTSLVLEGTSTNLLNSTENAKYGAWEILGGGDTGTVIGAGQAPDGSNNAIKIIEATTNVQQHGLSQNLGVISSGANYTLSVYAKAAERTKISLTGFGEGYTVFDLSNGTITQTGGNSNANIVNAGGGWYRCSVTITKTNTNGTFYFIAWTTSNSYAGTVGSGVYIWGAQLEAGTTVTSYIPSKDTWTGRTSVATYFDVNGYIKTAATNQPRYTYNVNVLNAAPKLLLEQQSTNVIANTDTYTSSAVVSTGTAVAPDGTTAFKVIPNAGSVSYPGKGSTTLQSFSNSLTSGQTRPYTFSGYFSSYGPLNYKPYIVITANTGATGNPAYALVLFDPVTGGFTNRSLQTCWTEISPPTAVKHPCGMWYVTWSVLFTQQATIRDRVNHYFQIFNELNQSIYTADGASGVQYACMQFEESYTPTSYIPTTTAAVTRAADTMTSVTQMRIADSYSSSQVTRVAESTSITGTNFSSWFNSIEGTIFSSISTYRSISTGYDRMWELNNSSNSNSITVVTNPANSPTRWYAAITVSGNGQFDSFGTVSSVLSVNTVVNVAFAYKVNDSAVSMSGATPVTDTVCLIPAVDRLYIGCYNYAINQLNGHIKKLTFYPKRLTNAELQALTTQ